jgi:hypothetical protein
MQAAVESDLASNTRVIVIYVSYFPAQPSLSHLRTLLTKSLPTTVLVIYVSYLLSHFPPHLSLNRREVT